MMLVFGNWVHWPKDLISFGFQIVRGGEVRIFKKIP